MKRKPFDAWQLPHFDFSKLKNLVDEDLKIIVDFSIGAPVIAAGCVYLILEIFG